ncbi:cytoplasmic protein [Cryptococcus neoformans]|nr:cytoplasmic protein [Cryptococcus neoformans var. grubii]
MQYSVCSSAVTACRLPAMSLVSILTSLLKICCGSQEPTGPQQQQQQQHYGYPGTVNQQQTAYPPQSQPSWANVAAGGQQNHFQQQQYQAQQHQQGWQSPMQQQQGGWQSPPHQNGYAAGSPVHLPAGGVVGPHAPASQHMNEDQINATNQHYVDLRNKARKEGDEAHRCFAASQAAYQAGDGAKAHELSVQGKAHQRTQDQLDDQASAWIFNENNKDSPAGTIDLHGLYVKEAIERTEAAISDCQRQGREELRIIVGKGIHSQGGHAKIKPAVENLMGKYNLSAYIDPENTGVLVVDLEGKQTGPRSRDIGGMVDSLGKADEGCTIM